MRRSFLGVFLFLGLLFPGFAHAQGVATVTYLSGKVEKAPSVQVKLWDVFRAGDRLETGPRGTVELKLDDGSMVKLGEKTTVQIASLARQSSGMKTEIKVQQGKVRALVTKFAANRDWFELQGPTTVAGVSGSDLGADVTKDEDESYFGFDGRLYSKGTDGKPEALPVYNVVRYKGGKKVSGPSPMRSEDYADWEEMTFQTPGVLRPSITSQAGVSEKDAVAQVVRDLIDTYERRRLTAFMRFWNDEKYRGYNQLETDVESDFENYRDLRLNYKNARVTMAPGGRAIFEADWEKRYLIPGSLAEEKQTGRMQLLLEKEKGKWMVSGMGGERIFGSTGGLPDLTVTGLDVVSRGSAGAFLRRGTASAGVSRQTATFAATSVTVFQPATITATVKNLTRKRTDNVVVRFFEGSAQIGSDQRVSVPGNGTAQASVSWTPQLPLGTRTIKAVVDPDERVADVNRSNNAGQRQVDIKAGDAVLTVSPGTVTFPTGLFGDASITIRVVDQDRDNENRVNVVLRATYPNDMGVPFALATETETFELTKVSTGTFQRTSIPTCKSTDCKPASNNGRFEFRTSGGCVSSITVTVLYTEPLTSTGQTNVERTATFTAN